MRYLGPRSRKVSRLWDKIVKIPGVIGVIHSTKHRYSTCSMAVQKNRSSNGCRSEKKC